MSGEKIVGFKWGLELKKANKIIRELDESCGILNKMNDDLNEENGELRDYIRELRKTIVELEHSLLKQ